MSKYWFLKQKLSKTMKSVKYVLLNKEMSVTKRREYLKKIECGLTKMFAKEFEDKIKHINTHVSVDVVLDDNEIGMVDLDMSSLYQSNKICVYRFNNEFTPIIHGYLETFVSDVLSGDNKLKTEAYVDSIISEYYEKSDQIVPKLTEEKYKGRLIVFNDPVITTKEKSDGKSEQDEQKRGGEQED